jgi:hypothetical protein
LSFASSSIIASEGDGTASIAVTLNTAPLQDVSVEYYVLDGTAQAPDDYRASDGTLTFRAGETRKEFTITIIDDDKQEGDETVRLLLGNPIPSDTRLEQANATLTITDNESDAQPASPTATITATLPTETATLPTETATSPTPGTPTATPVPPSSPPEARDDTATTHEVDAVTIDVLSNDSDPDNDLDPTSVTVTNKPGNGTTSVNPDTGQITYTPDNGFRGSESFPYRVCDSKGACDTATVTVTVKALGTPGIAVNPTSLTVIEPDSSEQAIITLMARPDADVTINLSSSDPTACSVSPASVTLTSSNWSSGASITVEAVENDIAEGTRSCTIFTAPASSSDTRYHGMNADDVSVTVQDDDSPGIFVSPLSLNLSEPGGTAQVTIRLATQPTAHVKIGLSSSDTSECTVSSSSVTLTASNWSSGVNVTVQSHDDDRVDGNQTCMIQTAPANSSDSVYDNMDADDVAVSVQDDDSAGIIITESGGTTDVSEDNAPGDEDTYTVVLTSEPAANVIVMISTDAQVTADSPSLTFTSANWDTPQTVTVQAIDDDVDESSPHNGTVTHTASSSDSDYNSIGVNSVTARITDNDTTGVNVLPINVSVNEAGATTDTYTITLNSEPTANVTIKVSVNDAVYDQTDIRNDGPPASPYASSVNLTFTAANWNVPQTIRVRAIDDAIDEADPHQSTIEHQIVSGDSTYTPALPIVSVTADVADDDTRGVTVSPTNVYVNEEDAGNETDTYTIVLDSEPTASVTVKVQTSDSQVRVSKDGSTFHASVDLLFTPANWNTPQTVTVQVDNDGVDESLTHTSTLTHTATGGDYSGETVNNVTVHIGDANETPTHSKVPAAQTMKEDTTLLFDSGSKLFEIDDPDAGSGDMKVTLSVANGRLRFTTCVASCSGNNSSSVTLTGTKTEINNTLPTLRYTPDLDYNGPDTITIVTDDQGCMSGPAPGTCDPAKKHTVTDTVGITVTPVDDVPWFTLPSPPHAIVRVSAGEVTLSGWMPEISAGPAGLPLTNTDENTQTLTFNLNIVSTTPPTLTFDIVPEMVNYTSGGSGDLRFKAKDGQHGTAEVEITLSDGIHTSAPQTFYVIVNRSPILTNATMTLNDVNEDNLAPGTNNGTLVADILASGLPTDVIYDPTGPEEGIAVTGLDTSHGSWQYSTNGGASWSNVGSVSDTNARLLSADSDTRIRFRPTSGTHWNGTINDAITFRAWDQAAMRANGSTANITAARATYGDASSFSIASATANVTVLPVNDAPRFNVTDITLVPGGGTYTETDWATNVRPGPAAATDENVQNLSFTITSVTVTQGSITFASGPTVVYTGSPPSYPETADLQFEISSTDYGVAEVEVRLTDDGNGSAPDDNTAVRTFSIAVNTAPELTPGSVTLPAIDEDEPSVTNTGELVSDILSSLTVNDTSGPPDPGIAVTFADNSNGTWQYKPASGSWQNIGSRTDNSARLLAPTTRVRFVPDADWNGTVNPGIEFRAWDKTTGSDGATADTTPSGGSTAFSNNKAEATITVNPVNDPPVLVENNILTVAEGATDEVIDNTLLRADDVDHTTDQVFYRVDSVPAHGELKNGGATLSSGQQFTQEDIDNSDITYSHDNSNTTTDSFTFSIQDAAMGGTWDGPYTFTINVTSVNDPPVITEGASIARTMDEDDPSTFNLVLNATDPEGDTLTWGISSAASNGTASASGTGLSKTILYTPTLNYYGSDSFEVQVDDGNGGSDTITVDVTVTSINDPPVLTTNNVLTVTVSSTLTETIDTSLLVTTDVESASSAITYTVDILPANGALWRSGIQLVAGDTFTQEDIANTIVEYSYYTGTCTLPPACPDSFNFTVKDGDGAGVSDIFDIVIEP